MLLLKIKAFTFHYALAQGFAELAANQARQYQCRTIVLSGGVMHNHCYVAY